MSYLNNNSWFPRVERLVETTRKPVSRIARPVEVDQDSDWLGWDAWVSPDRCPDGQCKSVN